MKLKYEDELARAPAEDGSVAHILHQKHTIQEHNGKILTGKYAKAISDRFMEFPYREMVREWNGSFVHVSEFEPKQPQLEPNL